MELEEARGTMTLKSLALTAMLAAAAAPMWAQAPVEGVDPPSRVARLSYQSGSVSFRPGTVDEWGSATLNYPLSTGDHLWTDAGAQAEIHAGLAVIRMAPQTAIEILNLDDRIIQVSVTQGSVQIHVRSLEPDETIEVATPNVAVTLLRPGDYRVDSDGDNYLTTVTVRGGDAAVTGGGIAFPVHARQTARIRGMETVTEEVGAEIATNEFERWCESRDRREEQSVSAQYVPREMTGYEDLDDNGSWSNDSDYGWVWAPRTVAADWAPYRYGSWRWIEPWGWTWIDDSPWGFAPFHYGRWATVRGVWVWVPGHRTPGIRPVYAPALVVFVGGPRFGVSHAAWFPLGPREVYRPTYRVSDRYIRNVNVTHVTNINVTNVRYANQREGAVSAADNDSFARGRHIGRDSARLDVREIEQARVVGTTATIAPSRESIVTGSVRNAPPTRLVDRTVVVRTAAPPRPVPFGTRQRVLEVNQGRPLDASQVETLRRDTPGRPSMVRPASPARREVAPRVDRPQIQPAPVETPRGFDRPRQEQPARSIEQPRQQVEQPVPVETQRHVEQPRRTEPRAERPAPAQPAEGGRGAQRERNETKREQREERKQEQRENRRKNDQ